MIITIGRKPFAGAVVDTVRNLHCGAINIDSCRIKFETDGARKTNQRSKREDDRLWAEGQSGMRNENSLYADPRGRFPANVFLTEATGEILDQQSGETKGTIRKPTGKSIYPTEGSSVVWNNNNVKDTTVRGFADDGGASRYFKVIR